MLVLLPKTRHQCELQTAGVYMRVSIRFRMEYIKQACVGRKKHLQHTFNDILVLLYLKKNTYIVTLLSKVDLSRDKMLFKCCFTS